MGLRPGYELAWPKLKLDLALGDGGIALSATRAGNAPPPRMHTRLCCPRCVPPLTAHATATRAPQFLSLLQLGEHTRGWSAATRSARACALQRRRRMPRAVGAWWGYAGRAVLLTKRSQGLNLSWSTLLKRRKQRVEYVAAMRAASKEKLAELEKELSFEDITRYRD